MSDDNTIELNRRRVLGGLVTVGAAAAAAGAGTTALFSDTSNSTDNTVTAGELSLGEISSDPISIDDLYPSEDTADSKTAEISTEYTSDVDAVLDWGIKIVTNPESMASEIHLEEATLKAGDSSNDYSGDNDTLNELAETSPETGYSTISNDASISLTLDVRLDPDAGNDYQGKTIEFAVGFKARQIGSDESSSVDELSESDIKGN